MFRGSAINPHIAWGHLPKRTKGFSSQETSSGSSKQHNHFTGLVIKSSFKSFIPVCLGSNPSAIAAQRVASWRKGHERLSSHLIFLCFRRDFHLRDSAEPETHQTPELTQVLVCMPSSGIDSLPTTLGPCGAAILELFNISCFIIGLHPHLPASCLVGACVWADLFLWATQLILLNVSWERNQNRHMPACQQWSSCVYLCRHFLLLVSPQFDMIPFSTCPLKSISYLQIWWFRTEWKFSPEINPHIWGKKKKKLDIRQHIHLWVLSALHWNCVSMHCFLQTICAKSLQPPLILIWTWT